MARGPGPGRGQKPVRGPRQKLGSGPKQGQRPGSGPKQGRGPRPGPGQAQKAGPRSEHGAAVPLRKRSVPRDSVGVAPGLGAAPMRGLGARASPGEGPCSRCLCPDLSPCHGPGVCPCLGPGVQPCPSLISHRAQIPASFRTWVPVSPGAGASLESSHRAHFPQEGEEGQHEAQASRRAGDPVPPAGAHAEPRGPEAPRAWEEACDRWDTQVAPAGGPGPGPGAHGMAGSCRWTSSSLR